MPRGIPNVPKELAAPVGAKAPKTRGLETRLSPTGLNHIYNFDINGDGRLREVAIVKMMKVADGSIQSVYYIDVQLLDQVDKGRIKQAITSIHANKYELWDLLSQMTLNNGKNALDYFHQLVRAVHGPGAVNTQMGGGLMAVKAEGSAMVGAEFSDPGSASLETQSHD